ncbi:MAG TPA: hypothetical protein VF280_16120 [Burkholderiales bacterium]|jgi:hypothetical protein
MAHTLNTSGVTPPGGGNFPPLDSRVARLEIRMEHVESNIGDLKAEVRSLRERMDNDFRITWAGMIALAVGITGLMAKGFGWL